MAPGDPETVAAPEAPETEAETAVPETAVSEADVSEAPVPQTAAPEPPASESPAPPAPAEQSASPASPEPHSLQQQVHATLAPSPAATANGSGPAAAPLVESGQIRRALALAQRRTDLNWSVFIGTLGADPRVQAEARHAELGPAAAKSVLIAVDPTARHLEIVTGEHARKHLDDRSCALAAAAMTSSFAVRDLDGGIAYGILALVEHVRSSR